MKQSPPSWALPVVILLVSAPFVHGADDFNTQMMNSTFKIANEKSTATAFVLVRPSLKEPKKEDFLLITANHVLEPMSGEEATLFLRRKQSEGVYQKVPHKLPIRKGKQNLWTRHPTADVAVLPFTPPEGLDIPKLSVELLASDDILKKQEIHPGEMGTSLGYPHRVEANEPGFPVLRMGPISSYPLFPAKSNPTLLMSLNIFEGDSGGPVYLHDANREVDGKKQPTKLIMGIVTGQMFIDEDVKLIYSSAKTRHRLGLAIVVPANWIRETIDRLPKTP
jgi:hypothetical protein